MWVYKGVNIYFIERQGIVKDGRLGRKRKDFFKALAKIFSGVFHA
jgi:hypothetical protein